MDTLLCMRTFEKIAEAGSFVAAARILNLSPSTVTKHLLHLERRLGVRLINRNTRQAALTEAGAVYWQHCRDVLIELDHAESMVSGTAKTPRGMLRIAVPYDFGVMQIQPLIMEFAEEYPNIRIELSLDSRLIDVVRDEFDLAVRIVGKRNLDTSLIARRFATSRLIVCGAPDYLAKNRPLRPADLAAHNCLLYSGAVWRREWPFTRDGVTEKVALTGNIRSNDNLFLCGAAAAGGGLTIQPSFNVWKELRSGQLETVLDDWCIEELGVHAIFPHRQYLPSKVRAFVDFLVARFPEGADRDIWLDRLRAIEPARAPAGTVRH